MITVHSKISRHFRSRDPLASREQRLRGFRFSEPCDVCLRTCVTLVEKCTKKNIYSLRRGGRVQPGEPPFSWAADKQMARTVGVLVSQNTLKYSEKCTLLQPSCQNKCWRCTVILTEDVLKLDFYFKTRRYHSIAELVMHSVLSDGLCWKTRVAQKTWCVLKNCIAFGGRMNMEKDCLQLAYSTFKHKCIMQWGTSAGPFFTWSRSALILVLPRSGYTVVLVLTLSQCPESWS